MKPGTFARSVCSAQMVGLPFARALRLARPRVRPQLGWCGQASQHCHHYHPLRLQQSRTCCAGPPPNTSQHQLRCCIYLRVHQLWLRKQCDFIVHRYFRTPLHVDVDWRDLTASSGGRNGHCLPRAQDIPTSPVSSHVRSRQGRDKIQGMFQLDTKLGNSARSDASVLLR